MNFSPFGFKPIEPSTWAYLSSLLMLALFFKFNRFWSFRNFDLLLLILLAPGLLMVHYGLDLAKHTDRVKQNATLMVQEQQPQMEAANSQVSESNQDKTESGDVTKSADDEARVLNPHERLQRFGFIWIFAVGLIWFARLWYDPYIKRKPLLEPNLSTGGLVFLGCSLMIFLFANVLTSLPNDLSGPRGAAQIIFRSASSQGDELRSYGPGYPILHVIPSIATLADRDRMRKSFEQDRESTATHDQCDQSTAEFESPIEFLEVARIMAILSLIAIVGGLVFVGYQHFGSFQMGVGMATIFLMLPYTHQFAGAAMHMLPGALLIWAIASFRKPLVAGVLIGVAAGVCYYPFFLLPLWISFYWERGRIQFVVGALLSIIVVVSSLVFTSIDYAGFVSQLQSIFGFWWPRIEDLQGIWALNWEPWFRLPLMVGFMVLCISYAFWPVTKNLASLISCTSMAMIAVQYWHGDGGGLFMAWYLPLLLLIIFRPNLDDQVAVAVLNEPPSRMASENTGAVNAA